jgi:hypothetical protein
MEKVNLQLFKARDAEEAYAIRFPKEERWLARSGFGSQLEPTWSLEFQSEAPLERHSVDWEAVLGRAIEAYRLSGPGGDELRMADAVDMNSAIMARLSMRRLRRHMCDTKRDTAVTPLLCFYFVNTYRSIGS